MQGCKEEWGVSTLVLGIIASFYPLGLLIGSILWGVISDNYGRMHAFKATVLIATIASLGLVFSPSYQVVAACLCVLAIGESGELTLGGAVFYEFCPPSRRSQLTMLSMFLGIGSISIAVVALAITLLNNTYIYDWRYIIGFICIFEIVSLIFRYFMIETPAFYTSQGKFDKAEKVLNVISLKNTGKEFSFNDKDMSKSEMFEVDSSINDENKEGLLAKNPVLLKEICKKNFIKVSAILSAVSFI